MADRPNIIFILLDDYGWADTRCYGSTFYETPNLDRLAEQGMRFTDAYAACPVCSPTRASVMTGKYPARVGITNFIAGNASGKVHGVPYHHALPPEEHTVARALKAGGYRTMHVGKWHLGPKGHWPEDFGFDDNVAGCGWGMPQRGYFSPYQMPNLDDGPEGEYLTDRLTDEAVALVKDAAGDGKPWFLHLCHYAVHTPIQPPPDLVEKYKRKAKRLKLDQVDPVVEGERFTALHKKNQHVERRIIQSHADYAAMVENVDANIGRLLDAVDQLGQADNTLVIFTSDNGGLATAEGSPTCNAPLAEGKGWMEEGGVREPLIVRWPGKVRAGSVCSEPVTTPDYYPTMLEAAGLDPIPQQHVDGVSLMPLLTEGADTLGREAIYWHYPHYSNQGDHPTSAIRAGDWKLIESLEDGSLELYHLGEDLSETRNRADAEPDRVATLHGKLKAWRDAVGAKMPQPNPDYDAMLAGDKEAPNGQGLYNDGSPAWDM